MTMTMTMTIAIAIAIASPTATTITLPLAYQIIPAWIFIEIFHYIIIFKCTIT
jgi:hypothetical protein